jgi:hypothetical protein
MKRFVVILALVALMGIGCVPRVTVTVTPETEEILVEMAARRLAYHTALKMPTVIEPGLALVNAVLEGDSQGDPNKSVALMIAYFAQEINDPLLEQDLNDLMRLMHFTLEMTDEQLANMRYVIAAAKGIKRGLEAANVSR